MPKQGVSVVTCTNRPRFFKRLLNNYKRQGWKKKELIIVLNRDDMKLKTYREKTEEYESISVYKVPEHKNLGSCLNYGIRKAKYGIIAKFDDDDYYAPSYLKGMIRAMKRSGASIVGKRTFYMYLEGRKLLLLMRPKRQNRMVRHVAGATLFFKKKVAKKVPFSTRLKSGSDVRFLRKSRAHGFHIYSGDKYNFVAIRRKSKKNHTWKIKDSKLLKGNAKIIAETEHYRKRVKKKYSKKS